MRPFQPTLIPGLALLATLTANPASAVPIVAQVVDWTSASAGTVNGVSVSFTTSNGSTELVSDSAWVNRLFNSTNSDGLFSTAEGIEFSAGPATARNYTISFSAPVTGVVMHLGSLATTLTFDRYITRLSGQSNFNVAGNFVTGATVNSGPYSDANGSIGLGDLQSFSFSVSPYWPTGEGIGMQLVINPLPAVPEPGAWALMASGLGLLAWRRQGTRRPSRPLVDQIPTQA